VNHFGVFYHNLLNYKTIIAWDKSNEQNTTTIIIGTSHAAIFNYRKKICICHSIEQKKMGKINFLFGQLLFFILFKKNYGNSYETKTMGNTWTKKKGNQIGNV
jgi:hypothetical protein